MEVKKVTYGETLLRQSNLFLESRAQSMSLQICLAFLPFIADLTFGKI